MCQLFCIISTTSVNLLRTKLYLYLKIQFVPRS